MVQACDRSEKCDRESHLAPFLGQYDDKLTNLGRSRSVGLSRESAGRRVLFAAHLSFRPSGLPCFSGAGWRHPAIQETNAAHLRHEAPSGR